MFSCYVLCLGAARLRLGPAEAKGPCDVASRRRCGSNAIGAMHASEQSGGLHSAGWRALHGAAMRLLQGGRQA